MVFEITTWEELKPILNHPDNLSCIGGTGTERLTQSTKKDFLEKRVRYFGTETNASGYIRLIEQEDAAFLDHMYPRDQQTVDQVIELAKQLKEDLNHFYIHPRNSATVIFVGNLPKTPVTLALPEFPKKTTMFPYNNKEYLVVDLYQGDNLDKAKPRFV